LSNQPVDGSVSVRSHSHDGKPEASPCTPNQRFFETLPVDGRRKWMETERRPRRI
jgi:hypothetical protein